MHDDDEPGLLVRWWSSSADFLKRWWREASGPIDWSLYRTPFAAVWRRIFLWTPVAIVAGLTVAVVVVYALTGWRARDFANKAVANAENGQWHLAMVQVMSARNLRPKDLAVKRAEAVVETLARHPDAAAKWEALPSRFPLSDEDLRLKAIAMTRFGSEDHYRAALAKLEAAGLTAAAAEMRAVRAGARGDLDGALVEARVAAGDGSPDHRLSLLRLMATRHGPYLSLAEPTTGAGLLASREMIDLVDSLQGTPAANEALAVGLASKKLPPQRAVAWAELAWADLVPSNPALLPAATVLVANGVHPLDEVRRQLEAAFADAPSGQRALLASWLLSRGVSDAALEVLSERDASQDALAFIMRSEALAREGRWEDLMKQADAGTTAPASVRLLARAHAADKLKREGTARKSLQDAISVSLNEGLLPQTLEMADNLGWSMAADEDLLKMCGELVTAERAFGQARDRFGRRGQFAKLVEAHERAAAVAPQSPVVTDFRRYSDLLAGQPVNPERTAAAIARAPLDVNPRITHALALLTAGDNAGAMEVFDGFDVFLETLPPGQQAVLIAVLGRNGEEEVGRRAARRLDPNLLLPAEYALIQEWRVGP